MTPPTPASETLPAPPCALPADDEWFRVAQSHEAGLRSFLHRRFPHLVDVDDLVQESYLKLWRAKIAGKLRSARGFLYQSALNAAYDLFRHNAVVRMEPLTETDTSAFISDRPDAAESAALSHDLELLQACLDELPSACRQVLVLRRIHGLSHREIARKLSISEHTVEKQVYKGMKRCLESMQRRGVEWP